MSSLGTCFIFVLSATAVGFSIASLVRSNTHHHHAPAPTPQVINYELSGTCSDYVSFDQTSLMFTGILSVVGSMEPVSNARIEFVFTGGTDDAGNFFPTNPDGSFSIGVRASGSQDVTAQISYPRNSIGERESVQCKIRVLIPYTIAVEIDASMPVLVSQTIFTATLTDALGAAVVGAEISYDWQGVQYFTNELFFSKTDAFGKVQFHGIPLMAGGALVVITYPSGSFTLPLATTPFPVTVVAP